MHTRRHIKCGVKSKRNPLQCKKNILSDRIADCLLSSGMNIQHIKARKSKNPTNFRTSKISVLGSIKSKKQFCEFKYTDVLSRSLNLKNGQKTNTLGLSKAKQDKKRSRSFSKSPSSKNKHTQNLTTGTVGYTDLTRCMARNESSILRSGKIRNIEKSINCNSKLIEPKIKNNKLCNKPGNKYTRNNNLNITNSEVFANSEIVTIQNNRSSLLASSVKCSTPKSSRKRSQQSFTTGTVGYTGLTRCMARNESSILRSGKIRNIEKSVNCNSKNNKLCNKPGNKYTRNNTLNNTNSEVFANSEIVTIQNNRSSLLKSSVKSSTPKSSKKRSQSQTVSKVEVKDKILSKSFDTAVKSRKRTRSNSKGTGKTKYRGNRIADVSTHIVLTSFNLNVPACMSSTPKVDLKAISKSRRCITEPKSLGNTYKPSSTLETLKKRSQSQTVSNTEIEDNILPKSFKSAPKSGKRISNVKGIGNTKNQVKRTDDATTSILLTSFELSAPADKSSTPKVNLKATSKSRKCITKPKSLGNMFKDCRTSINELVQLRCHKNSSKQKKSSDCLNKVMKNAIRRCKSNPISAVDDIVKSSAKKGRKSCRLIPTRNSLKRKRWITNELNDLNTGHEDDLFASRSFNAVKNVIVDMDESDFTLSMPTPKCGVSITPVIHKKTPVIKDCCSPTQFALCRKAAEECQYRNKKRKVVIQESSQPEKKKLDFSHVIARIDELVGGNDRSMEDSYFSFC